MKKAPKRQKPLTLNRETLRALDARELNRIAGALPPTHCCFNTEECVRSCVVC